MNSIPSSQDYKQNDTSAVKGKNIKQKSIQDQRNAHVSIISLGYIKQLKNVFKDNLKHIFYVVY